MPPLHLDSPKDRRLENTKYNPYTSGHRTDGLQTPTSPLDLTDLRKN